MDVTCLYAGDGLDEPTAVVTLLRNTDRRISRQKQLDGHIKALLKPR